MVSDVDVLWLLIAGAMVFLMQLGFAVLEAGAVRAKNANNILFKNLMDASLGALVWFLIGFAFAYGSDDDGPFIGAADFALTEASEPDFSTWFFQWTFAATAATIVSGSVAERTKLEAYFLYSVVITGFIYPVVVHWVWDGQGWLSAFSDPLADNAAIDFAGSGVVHMVGGFSGLMGAIIVGPRSGRFDGKSGIEGHNIPFTVLGTFLLWFGWYGFNCGSTLAVDGVMGVAARVACTTTLAAAAGCVTVTLLARVQNPTRPWDLNRACNGALAGLVSITAGCAVMNPGPAVAVGIIGGFIYMGSSLTLAYLGVDDPLDAFSVHGAAGVWGVLAAGLFKTSTAVSAAYSDAMAARSVGHQFRAQVVEVVSVAAWTMVTSGLMFLLIKYTIGLRVTKEVEEAGMDCTEHGAAYNFAAPRSYGSGRLPITGGEKQVILPADAEIGQPQAVDIEMNSTAKGGNSV